MEIILKLQRSKRFAVFRYIVKRLLLIIPTLFLVSCLTFFLSKQVPADQVDILLNIQGIDEADELYTKEYDRLYRRMNLHLPQFYVSVRPNYAFDFRKHNLDTHERQFAHALTELKYSKAYIQTLLHELQSLPAKSRRILLNSTGPEQLKEKILAQKDDLTAVNTNELLNLIQAHDVHQVRWHYPVLRYHGPDNQYHHWLSDVLAGDFGISLSDTRPVTDKLWEAMKWSVLLLMLNLILAILLAFPLGVYNGMHPHSTFDTISNGVLFAFFAIPKFWLATLMIIFFTTAEYGNWSNIFPTVGNWYPAGAESFFSMLSKSWTKLILPLIILVIPDVAYLGRLIRATVQEERNKEYIKTAISKGVSKKALTAQHILPNALIPVITLLVGTLPGALASGLVIEVIFNIPGVGRLMYESIDNADWAMVYPIVLVISVLAVVLFLIGDILMAYLNPKIKLG